MYNKSIFKLRNFLAIIALVSITFMSCNNEGEKKEEQTVDTTPLAPAPEPVVDTTKKDTNKMDTGDVKPVPTRN
jgi:hypothetical protein